MLRQRSCWVALVAGLLWVGCGGSSADPASSPEDQEGPSATDGNGPSDGGDSEATLPDGIAVARSALLREESPEVPTADRASLAQGNTAFALDLYKRERANNEGNLLLAPYSASAALAMTYAGARGDTETQMAQALHFELPQEQLHAAFNQLDRELGSRDIELSIANATFGHQGYSFLDAYLDVLAVNYGAPMYLVDFEQTEQARGAINQWVSDHTAGHIDELLVPGIVNTLTRLVLTNAVYFRADWLTEFDDSATEDAPFHLADGTTAQVPMMNQQASLSYAEGSGWQAVELPYTDDRLRFVAVLPATDQPDIDLNLDVAALDKILGSLSPQTVALNLPRFTFSAEVDLAKHLEALGMVDAFGSRSDLSGMDGTDQLHIQAALQQTFIEVNEQGTEAAGATAVVVGLRAAAPEPITVTLDRPFVILVRDEPTDTVLFLGRVADPTQE